MRRWRLSVISAAWLALVASLVLIAVITSAALERQARERAVIEVQGQALLFREQLGGTLGVERSSELQRLCHRFASLTGNRAAVVSPAGHVLADSRTPPSTSEGIQTSATLADDPQEISLALPVRSGGATLGSVQVGMPAAAVRARTSGIRQRVVAATLLLLGLATGILLTVNHRLRQPLELIRRNAQRLAHGDIAGNLVSPPPAEMAGLAEALEQMADQLEERFGLFSRRGSEHEAVLASMVEGVLAVDSQERVISLNAAAASLLDTDPDRAKDRGLQEVIRNADLRRFVVRALASDQPIEDDLVLRLEEQRVLQARGTSLRDARGRPIGAVIVLNDVTHLRRLENIRRDFVANVSHELKTPITSIKGFVETLLDGALQSPEDSERFLRIIARQADRLNAIIEDLLSLAKIEQANAAADVVLEPCRLSEVLQTAIDECGPRAAERNIAIRLTCDAELIARASPALLEQAVVNLLDNALKYSDPEGEVHIEVQQGEHETLIQVHDQGCGIEAEHLDRLFERFYRVDKARSRKQGGTGLGLAIVKHIASVHGGRVTVVSSPRQGSTFTIHLPNAEREVSISTP